VTGDTPARMIAKIRGHCDALEAALDDLRDVSHGDDQADRAAVEGVYAVKWIRHYLDLIELRLEGER
jgi:hypothetical protein